MYAVLRERKGKDKVALSCLDTTAVFAAAVKKNKAKREHWNIRDLKERRGEKAKDSMAEVRLTLMCSACKAVWQE